MVNTKTILYYFSIFIIPFLGCKQNENGINFKGGKTYKIDNKCPEHNSDSIQLDSTYKHKILKGIKIGPTIKESISSH